MSAPDQMHADHFSEEQDAQDLPLDGMPGRSETPQHSTSDDWIEEARQESDRRRASRELIDNTGRSQFATTPNHFPGSGSIANTSRSIETDEELFRRYQNGDQRAFLTIYERYKSNIYAYCARVLLGAGLEREQVEDTFQDVFLRLAQYQHTFTGGEFKAWIFTVTRHSCLSSKKKGLKRKITTEYVGDGENLDEDVNAEVRAALQRTDDPLERMSRNEQTDLLLKAIAMLPETYREALILSDYEGLTYDEIGKLTGTSLSTIRIRIFRAKARLRKMLLPIIGDQVDELIPPPDSSIE